MNYLVAFCRRSFPAAVTGHSSYSYATKRASELLENSHRHCCFKDSEEQRERLAAIAKFPGENQKAECGGVVKVPKSSAFVKWELIFCDMYEYEGCMPVMCRSCWKSWNLPMLKKLVEVSQDSASEFNYDATIGQDQHFEDFPDEPARVQGARGRLQMIQKTEGWCVLSLVPQSDASINKILTEWENIEPCKTAEERAARKETIPTSDPMTWWKDFGFVSREPVVIPFQGFSEFCRTLSSIEPKIFPDQKTFDEHIADAVSGVLFDWKQQGFKDGKYHEEMSHVSTRKGKESTLTQMIKDTNLFMGSKGFTTFSAEPICLTNRVTPFFSNLKPYFFGSEGPATTVHRNVIDNTSHYMEDTAEAVTLDMCSGVTSMDPSSSDFLTYLCTGGPEKSLMRSQNVKRKRS
jgi:hypothetical protein